MTNGTPTVKILDMTVLPSAEAGRMGKKDVVITYQDEHLRTKVVTLPYEQIEGKSHEEQLAVVATEIRRMEAERRQFIGQEIKI